MRTRETRVILLPFFFAPFGRRTPRKRVPRIRQKGRMRDCLLLSKWTVTVSTVACIVPLKKTHTHTHTHILRLYRATFLSLSLFHLSPVVLLVHCARLTWKHPSFSFFFSLFLRSISHIPLIFRLLASRLRSRSCFRSCRSPFIPRGRVPSPFASFPSFSLYSSLSPHARSLLFSLAIELRSPGSFYLAQNSCFLLLHLFFFCTFNLFHLSSLLPPCSPSRSFMGFSSLLRFLVPLYSLWHFLILAVSFSLNSIYPFKGSWFNAFERKDQVMTFENIIVNWNIRRNVTLARKMTKTIDKTSFEDRT